MPIPNLCRAVWLGDLDYQKAYALQLSLVEKVLSGQEANTLLMLEHPHVYTKGRLSKDSDVLLTEEELAAKGIPVYETDRGGQVTYHGPGQLVVYPIVNLKDWGGPVKYVRALEQVVIATLTEMGIIA
ncbi:MAG: lipoyl(octanoyl) transferase, partial [Chloroflexota bacterium]|nr:lipoyl(octanoyl) transferase [Chloroflexota bacterium]